MSDQTIANDVLSLHDLGWSDFFDEQIGADERGMTPGRVATVHRARITAMLPTGLVQVALPPHVSTADFTVGDWILVDPQTGLMQRRLNRKTVLERRPEGSKSPQLAGANIDTLFIVTSCNADFNPARLERYLALANQAGTHPVIVLTKADTVADAAMFEQQAAGLQRGLDVISLNAKSADAALGLVRWTGVGQTVALVGSSGVGKSTLVNTLAGPDHAAPQLTGGVRESDAKGRHTTTSRSLHRIAGGGWVIDTPGIRTLHVSDVGSGIDALFAEITELAPQCKFRDCTHAHEPGCAVRAAIAAGTLDGERFTRWQKLLEENHSNAQTPATGRTGAGRKRKR